MKNLFKNIVFGIGWGCTIFVILGIIFSNLGAGDMLLSNDEYTKQAICAMIVGLGFTVPSIVYDNDKLSRGIQVLIHMGIGLMVYFLVAFYAGWIVVKNGVLVTIATIIIMIIISFIIWFGFYLYNKNEAKKINEKLKAR